MKRIYISILAIMNLMSGSVQAAEIDWKVKHPFRFFETKANDKPSPFFEMYKAAWNELESEGVDLEKRISEMEAKLNHGSWLQNYYDKNARALGLNRNSVRTGNAGAAHAGWARWIVANNHTCWNASHQWHSSCKVDQGNDGYDKSYVMPKKHTVLAHYVAASGEQLSKNALCRWTFEPKIELLGYGERSQITLNCKRELSLRIPYAPDRKTGLSEPVEVTVAKSGSSKTAHSYIAVRDRLVVGLGDSFSSGEGNPDIPARMKQGDRSDGIDIGRGVKSKKLKANGLDYEIMARRSKNWSVPERVTPSAYARWLDRNCHRSMYSYHMRTALQLAVEADKDEAITFLGYACSGAKLVEGILFDYEGAEKASGFGPKGAIRRNKPQLHRLMEELCKEPVDISKTKETSIRLVRKVEKTKGGYKNRIEKISLPFCGGNRANDYVRPIDLMIVSIGGNDVGFAQLVAKTFLTSDGETTVGGFTKLARHIAEQWVSHGIEYAEKKLDVLPGRFKAFGQALRKTGIPVRNHKAGTANILITGFPIIQNNQRGRTCATTGTRADRGRESLRGSSGSAGFMRASGSFLDQLSLFQARLNDTVRSFAKESPGAKSAFGDKWIFVEDHIEVFKYHGFCAQKQPYVSDDGNKFIGSIGAPYYRENEMMILPAYKYDSRIRGGGEWRQGISAENFGCYRTRQRWVRSFDDAYMCINNKQIPEGKSFDKTDILAQSISGVIHPTAEGHSHIADAIWNKIHQRKMLD